MQAQYPENISTVFNNTNAICRNNYTISKQADAASRNISTVFEKYKRSIQKLFTPYLKMQTQYPAKYAHGIEKYKHSIQKI